MTDSTLALPCPARLRPAALGLARGLLALCLSGASALEAAPHAPAPPADGAPTPIPVSDAAAKPGAGGLAAALVQDIDRLARSVAGATAPDGGAALPATNPDQPDGSSGDTQAQIGPVGDAASQTPRRRIEVEVGQLNPRLKLAPCERIEPYWPRGQKLLGHARVGLRCTQGPTRWNVYLPVSIRLWVPGWVATTPLPAGTTLNESHLRPAEVDLGARAGPAVQDLSWALGRRLKTPVAAGQALHRSDLRLREWVRVGDTVRVIGRGASFQILSEARAMGSALEGQTVRARTSSGRIVQGVATGERQIAVAL